MTTFWRAALVLVVLAYARVLPAQSVYVDLIVLNTGPCTESSGSGSPETAVVGVVCDTYHQTNSPYDIWRKTSGTGNTGWTKLSTGGTVTSVGLALPAEFTVSNSPVTVTGNLTAVWATALANRIFAGPVSGGAGTPSFRLAVEADIPVLSVSGKVLNSATSATAVNTASAIVARDTVGGVALGIVQVRGGNEIRFYDSTNADYAYIQNPGSSSATGALQYIALGSTGIGHRFQTNDPVLGVVNALQMTPSATLLGPGFVSQTSGWGLTARGALDVRYLYTDELRAKLFTADLESVLAGSQRVTKSFSTISQTFACPAASGTATLWVKDATTFGDAAVFALGDTVVMRSMTRSVFGPFTIGDCVGVVTAYVDGTGANAGQQSWTFTRNAGGNAGAMIATTGIAVNELVQDLGVTGNGYVETSAVDGAAGINAPYTQIVTWATAPVAANLTVRARLGNLRGITTVAEYGLIAGTFATSNGQYFRASDQAFELHGIDLSLWSGSTKTVFLNHATSPTSPSFALGAAVPPNFSTGTGIWMGNDGGTYKFRVGVPGAAGMFWDGSTLAVIGAVTATTGTIGGWTIGATSLSAGSGATTVAMDSGGTNPAFYAGSAVPSSAPFQVSNTGAITASSGTVGGFTLCGTYLANVSCATSGAPWILNTSGVLIGQVRASVIVSNDTPLIKGEGMTGAGWILPPAVAVLGASVVMVDNTLKVGAHVLPAVSNGAFKLDVTGAAIISGMAQLSGGASLATGQALRFYDSTNADYAYMQNPGSSSATQGLTFNAFGSNGHKFVTYDGTVRTLAINAAGDFVPSADNTHSVGTAALRFTLVRAVTITPGDLRMENGWTLTEHDKVGIDQPGLAVLDPFGNLVAFFGRDAFYSKPARDIGTLAYTQTTPEERSRLISSTKEQ